MKPALHSPPPPPPPQTPRRVRPRDYTAQSVERLKRAARLYIQLVRYSG